MIGDSPLRFRHCHGGMHSCHVCNGFYMGNLLTRERMAHHVSDGRHMPLPRDAHRAAIRLHPVFVCGLTSSPRPLKDHSHYSRVNENPRRVQAPDASSN